jgi:hypothetical protein
LGSGIDQKIIERVENMIHHVSIEANDPMKVATVIAKLMGGKARQDFPFKNSCGAFAEDEHGTMFECYQRGKVLTAPEAKSGKFEMGQSDVLQEFQAFHTAISVEIDDDAIMAIAKEAGWQTGVRANGPFSVVEVWIENRLLLEVLSPPQTEKYLRVMAPDSARRS